MFRLIFQNGGQKNILKVFGLFFNLFNQIGINNYECTKKVDVIARE